MNLDDQLFTLIKSLTKAEKRHFKLYASRTKEDSGSLKFILLFDSIDKMEGYNEDIIEKKMSTPSKSQLSNLKRHLYKQILTSLRLLHAQKNIDIDIREQLDYARILYQKGLYMQSLKLLDRCQIIAEENHLDLLHLEILEFQKLIEERHITRSRTMENKIEQLTEASTRRSLIIHRSCLLANLKIEIHGYYIKHGHVRGAQDEAAVRTLFEAVLRDADVTKKTFFEKIYLHQAYVWYYYILLDFPKCYRHAKAWVELFNITPRVKAEDPDLYMRGLHYVLTSLYNMGKVAQFEDALQYFIDFEKEMNDNFNQSSEILAFLYLDTARINRHYLRGTFVEGLEEVPTIMKKLANYEQYLDLHRILVFHYKLGYLYLGAGDYATSLDHLNQITNLNAGHLREDLQCYARLLQLVVHYELGNFELLAHLVSSTQRFMERFKNLNLVQEQTLRLFKRLINLPKNEHRRLFLATRETLKTMENDRYARRDILYLDMPAWLDAKVNGLSLSKIIQEKNSRNKT